MSCIQELLSKYSREVERKLRPHLGGAVRGALIRTQLPQNWNFKTEEEELIFNVNMQGVASIKPGQSPDPDVTIEWIHDYLRTVLEKRSAEGLPPGEEPRIVFHSSKGQVGFNMVRKHLGL